MTIIEIDGERIELRCKGLCRDSCGPVPMTAAEVATLQAATGRTYEVAPLGDRFIIGPLQGKDGLDCPALADGKCSGYEARPLVCRLWGMVDHRWMRCPHGCAPTPRWITNEESARMLGLKEPPL